MAVPTLDAFAEVVLAGEEGAPLAVPQAGASYASGAASPVPLPPLPERPRPQTLLDLIDEAVETGQVVHRVE